MQRSRRSSSLANASAELKPCQVIRDTPQNNLRRPEYFSDFLKICKMSADEERIWQIAEYHIASTVHLWTFVKESSAALETLWVVELVLYLAFITL